MLEYASEEKPVVVAFWDGKSRGTGDMISCAKSAGAVCHIIRYEETYAKEIEEIVKTVLSGI